MGGGLHRIRFPGLVIEVSDAQALLQAVLHPVRVICAGRAFSLKVAGTALASVVTDLAGCAVVVVIPADLARTPLVAADHLGYSVSVCVGGARRARQHICTGLALIHAAPLLVVYVFVVGCARTFVSKRVSLRLAAARTACAVF